MRSKKYTEDDFIKAVESSFTIAEILEKLGLQVRPGNYATIHRWVKRLGLDTSHWIPNKIRSEKLSNFSKGRAIPIEKILVKNSEYTATTNLKNRLIQAGLLKYECSDCLITSWRGQKISLQLDHINGTRTDNRIDNLRLLCPNCHSQTDTFCRKKSKAKRYFCSCGEEITSKSKCCVKCQAKNNEKITWPSIKILTQMVKETNYSAAGRKLGVTDNAIRKRLRHHTGIV